VPSQKKNHPSKQTNSPSLSLPSTQVSSVPINRLFAHQFIVQYGPQISEQQFLKCVTSDYRLRVVETFIFFAISRFLVFRIARRRFGTFYGPMFMNQLSPKNSRQVMGRLLCGETLRLVVFPRGLKGDRPSIIEDTDTLVSSTGQIILSQNRKLSSHTNSPICIN